MKRGRPTLYTEEIAKEIIDRLESGEPLVKICDRNNMPGLRTVYDWEAKIDGLTARVLMARAIGHDRIAADALEIADDTSHDFVDSDNGPRFNSEAVMRSKLRVDTRLKLLSKWDRKRYGDEAPATNLNLTNSVQIVQVTEDRRRELIERKKAANERLRALKAQAKEAKQGEA